MPMYGLKRAGKHLHRLVTITVLTVGLLIFWTAQQALADQVQNRSVKLASSLPDRVTDYQIGFTLPSGSDFHSVQILFCSNSALPEDDCDAPPGFDVSLANLQPTGTGNGASINGATTTNSLVINRAAGAGGQVIDFTVDNVHNPSMPGSFFARISTYDSADASGSATDRGSVAMRIGQDLNVQAEVPPYLTFCVGVFIDGTDCNTARGQLVDIGTIGSNRTASGTMQLLAATNAQNGYAVYANGPTIASGNNTIAPLSRPTPSRTGSSQFGINLVANGAPAVGSDPSGPGVGVAEPGYNQRNAFQYRPGDVVAGSAVSDNYRKYTASYIVNVPQGQPGGVYNTTFTYVCLANF